MPITQLDTSTLSNQNISSALNVHTFTNTTRLRKMYIDVFATQLAGNGDYIVYATRQRAGSGAAYEIGARTTVAVPSGVTSQMFPTIALMCGATDVIKVYVVGLPADTTTPDIITDVSEEYVAATSTLTAQEVWEYATREITGGGGSAADVWAYATRTLTQGAASVASTVAGSTLTLYRGASWSIALTGLGNITGYSKLWFTVKTLTKHTDAQAVVQVLEDSATAGVDGLIYLNGAAASDGAQGAITVDDATAGNITITLDEAASALLTPATKIHYDVKVLNSGSVTVLADGVGKFNISADVTRTIA
jgi:hypothetical protein